MRFWIPHIGWCNLSTLWPPNTRAHGGGELRIWSASWHDMRRPPTPKHKHYYRDFQALPCKFVQQKHPHIIAPSGEVVVGRILQPNVVWIHQGMMFFPQRNLVHHWFICITCYVYGYTAPQVLHDDFWPHHSTREPDGTCKIHVFTRIFHTFVTWLGLCFPLELSAVSHKFIFNVVMTGCKGPNVWNYRKKG